MSRLYAWISSDLSKSKTQRANKQMNITVNYGSRDDSKEAVKLTVAYLDGQDKPIVFCDVADGLKLHSNRLLC